MQATDAADTVQEVSREQAGKPPGGLHKFENRAALVISVLAMLLAITSVAGNDNLQTILQTESKVNDVWAFYQARNIRRTSTLLTKEQLELQLLSQGAGWDPEV